MRLEIHTEFYYLKCKHEYEKCYIFINPRIDIKEMKFKDHSLHKYINANSQLPTVIIFFFFLLSEIKTNTVFYLSIFL